MKFLFKCPHCKRVYSKSLSTLEKERDIQRINKAGLTFVGTSLFNINVCSCGIAHSGFLGIYVKINKE